MAERRTLIPLISRGDVITADPFLNGIVRQLNEQIVEFDAPTQVGEGVPTSTNATVQATEIWQELARTTETVRVTNPDDDEDYVDVERAREIIIRKSDGTLVVLALAE